MPTRVLFRAITLIALVAVAGTASAGEADEQKAMARAQRMLRQMSLERDAAQADNARLKNEVEELNRKLGGLKKSSEAALAKSRESNTTLNDSLQQTVQKLHKAELEKNQLQDMVDGQAELIQSCESKNAKLVQANRELLGRYEKKGFFDTLLQREPLTQLKRVEIENIVQEYQDEIDRQEFKKNTTTAVAH
jgi:chromosome segregation ATPase